MQSNFSSIGAKWLPTTTDSDDNADADSDDVQLDRSSTWLNVITYIPGKAIEKTIVFQHMW